MKTLTEKQKRILEYIYSFTAENRYPPSIREIGTFFGMKSNNAVNDHLEALKRKECIRRSGEKHTSRSIVITPTGYKNLGIADPSAASEALLCVPVIEQADQIANRSAAAHKISLDAALVAGTSQPGQVGANDLFAYKAKGDQMAAAGIRSGDILIVRSQDKANSDDIALIRRSGDLSVRRCSMDGDKLRLQTADDAATPEYVDAASLTDGNFAILGVIVGLIRTKI